MAIPAELASYRDEADFRDRFLMPLLFRLGFSVVVNYHGKREFGRDIIFGEIDRFGHVLYYAVQAKYVGSVSQSDSHGLVADAREAFSHEFFHPHRQTRERICRFYVANGGSIAPNARDNFFEIIEKPLAANCTLVDGTALVALDRFASLNRGTLAKELLSGLLFELRCNRATELDKKLQEFVAGSPYPMVRLRLAATTAMLERPVIGDPTFLVALQEYWHMARTMNQVTDSIDVPFDIPGYQRARAIVVIDLAAKLQAVANMLEARLSTVIQELGSTIV